jgi:hypothetical protein
MAQGRRPSARGRAARRARDQRLGGRSWHNRRPSAAWTRRSHRCASVLSSAAPRVERESRAARRHRAGDELARGGHGRAAVLSSDASGSRVGRETRRLRDRSWHRVLAVLARGGHGCGGRAARTRGRGLKGQKWQGCFFKISSVPKVERNQIKGVGAGTPSGPSQLTRFQSCSPD